MAEPEKFFEEEELAKSAKFVAINLLRILKFFYSFKELEKFLDVPSQVLWRYLTLKTFPERETALEIIKKIREQKLVERAVEKALAESPEPWAVFSNPGALELAAFSVAEELEDEKFGAVVSAPDAYSAALAALVSAYLKAKLCISSRSPLSLSYVAESFLEGSLSLEVAALPRECVPKRSKVLVVAAHAANPSALAAAVELAKRCHAEVEAVFCMVCSKKAVEEVLSRISLSSKPKVTVMVDLDKRAPAKGAGAVQSQERPR